MGKGVLLLGGLAAWWFLSKANTGMKLQFVPLGASWDGGALRIAIGVQNPTGDTLQFNSLSGSVYVNGGNAGNISSFTPTTIMANGQTTVEVRLTPNYLTGIPALLNSLLGIIRSSTNIVVSVQGTANVNSIPLPINLSFQTIAA